MSKPVMVLVGMDYKGPPEKEEEFSKWYSESHVPFCLNTTNKIKKAERYKLITVMRDMTGQPKYLALYWFPDREAFEAWYPGPEFQGVATQRRQYYSDDVFSVQLRGVYEFIQGWQKD